MEQENHFKSKSGMDMLKKVQTICKQLPETFEKIDGFGHILFQVNDKSFVRMGESETGVVLAIKADPFTQENLIQQPYYFKTPYIGRHGWVSIKVDDPVNDAEIDTLIKAGYRLAAPKRLTKSIK
jgi:predicted DNA-binding protein (MmcQ/YjbR family)